MLAIRAGRLLDGTGRALTAQVVLVDGERITAVGSPDEVQIPPDSRVIDASDRTLMPGMVDAHLHMMGNGDARTGEGWDALRDSLGRMALRCYLNARRNLDAGVTAIRDAGNFGYSDVAVRDAIDQGLVDGPRMVVAGEALTSTGGHADRTRGLAEHVRMRRQHYIADGPDEARHAVRYQIKMGADFIKISASLSAEKQEMSLETMQAICQTAHWLGKRVAAHCSGGSAVTDALAAGTDSLEHGRFLTDAHLATMAERGVYLVPTLAPEGRAMQHGQAALGYDDRTWRWMVGANALMYETVARAHRIGVKIAAGSDAAMPGVRHGDVAYEIELLAKAGLSPMEAIVAGTRVGAEVLGLAQETGTIEKGKLADFLVIDGDPLADVRILQDRERIRHVIKGGGVVVSKA